MDPAAAKDLYDDWADSYTDTVKKWGYNMPDKTAEILAKHDEDYMPKEVVDALKEQGVYKEADGS